MEHVIENLSKYMLCDDLMKEMIIKKYNFQRISKEDSLKKIKCIEKEISKKENMPVKFEPKEKDSLFWCFYIASKGDVSYEMIEYKNIIVEKKIKYDFIEIIRKNKDLLKQYKFATLTHLENQLANEDKIDLKTALSLSVIENLNILYINKNTYYEHLMNDKNELHVFHNLENNRYCYYKVTSETIKDTIESLYKMDNIEKPLKSISSYKVDDLIQIANKLGINTISNTSKKIKNKKELYESIVLYL
jgi:hypothetical protein